jgi:NitT/TauT family transport system substrate-binding protein
MQGKHLKKYSQFSLLTLAFFSTQIPFAQAVAAGAPFTFITNWYAQAEHGGYYQAKAEGLYQQKGLDVTLRMGGPQVNGIQLLAAGQAECIIADDIGVMMAQKRGLPVQLVATTFQFDPTVIITHPDVTSLSALKGHTVLISTSAHSSWWPWAKKKFGYTDAMTRPYTFNIQPFVIDKKVAQQGYMTSEPFALQKAGVNFHVFSIGEEGYPPYGNSIACRNDAIAQHPQQIQAFLAASMQGWKDYLNRPAAGNAAIKKDNPNMGDDQIAYSINKLKTSGIVTGGDAKTLGIGVITDARMAKTWQMATDNGLFHKNEVPLNRVYTTRFIDKVKVMP